MTNANEKKLLILFALDERGVTIINADWYDMWIYDHLQNTNKPTVRMSAISSFVFCLFTSLCLNDNTVECCAKKIKHIETKISLDGVIHN